MALVSKDKIEFDTSAGPKVIELLYGDITAMPNTPKADILMVSAFHGDYTPTHMSLIGALKRNLNVAVGNLASDKEEDLRRLFHCWWSRPLREDLPFRRLLCFETSRSGVSPQKAVQSIFKALVPACSLFTDGTVVSPLLSTGDQNNDEQAMLQAIVSSAAVWMKNGLSINRFKLVIYRGNDQILETFRMLKREYNRLPGAEMRFKSIRPPVAKYDFYLSYVDEENSDMQRVKNLFLEHQDNLRFFTPDKSVTAQLTQERIFEVMQTCTRVIAFLSPSYLEDDDRVEEYNAAWCLNRKQGSMTRLAPMLCHDISGLPTYMSLIQWVDIRLQNGQTEKLIRNVTLYVAGYIQEFSPDIGTKMADTSKTAVVSNKRKFSAAITSSSSDTAEKEKEVYDIFLSYAHADESVCKLLVAELQKEIPAVKIFIDRDELRTGGSWQQKLYHALESSHITIALVSPSYLKSRMCNEEFKMSIARHFTEEGFHLLPVHIADLDYESLADRYTSIHNLTVGDQDCNSYLTEQLVPVVKQYLVEDKCDNLCFHANKTTYDLTRLLEDGRCVRLAELIADEPSFDETAVSGSIQIQILSSKEKYDSDIAHEIKDRFLHKFQFPLVQKAKTCQVELSADDDTASNLKKLDDATLIIVLISSNFLEDADLIEELQVAINRQRYDKKTRLYPVMLCSSLSVTSKHYHIYCELLLYETCLTDVVWENISIEQLMQRHRNYKDAITECQEFQEAYDRECEHSDLAMQGENNSETLLKRAEKNNKLKRVKFIDTVCNRAAYHISHSEQTENEVLIDAFDIIKHVVLGEESKEKLRAAAIERIGQLYDKKTSDSLSDEKTSNSSSEKKKTSDSPSDEKTKAKPIQAVLKGEEKEPRDGKKNIDRMKNEYTDNGAPKSSSACVLL